MKLYRYDASSLSMQRVGNLKIVAIGLSIFILGYLSRGTDVRYVDLESDSEAVVLSSSDDQFSVDALRSEMERCGIRFVDIVLAQAKIETGNFTSRIFMEANNLFGMKLARQRNTTAVGEFSGHAMYDDWRQSVMDYALYQSTYLRKIRTKEQYLEYLSNNYAEDPSYVNKIKQRI